ncbi:YdcF family protein [Noviherbaspirillum autotrophicum]|uniref:Membrane protein n=1 Tax=Noviherbaspirillum autotrophicum TaxID=709839 RepID=A0A0C2BPW2_9BURK|nr:YdcF family protein [Noviherbaspirillum autotrophicum]KIF82119.1 membrane protein [Noviherbaspirillum autotrophicum]
MNLSLIVTKTVSALLLPPLNLILLCTIGLLLHTRRPRLGRAISAFALVTLAVISTPAGALLLVAPLEHRSSSLMSAQHAGAQAIVVLGGGRIRNAPEYGGRDTPKPIPLVRLRYAAQLYRETGLPVLVSGGAPDGAAESEAAIMARSLREDFSVPVRWVEGGSDDTRQNAVLSAAILQAAGVQRILLVTDAMHMPRAQTLFTQTGLDVVAAPASLRSHSPLQATDFLPSDEGISRAHYALHEWIGLAWNAIRPR